jgi:hypothetical protein
MRCYICFVSIPPQFELEPTGRSREVPRTVRRSARDEYLSQDHDPGARGCLLCARSSRRSESKGARQYAPSDRTHQRGGPSRSDRLSQLPIPPSGSGEQVLLNPLGRALFSRNRFTIEMTRPAPLYFLNGDVQRAVIDQERKDNIIQAYIKDIALPYVEVVLDDLRQSPYSAGIEFEKVFTNPSATQSLNASDGQPT